jgi:hypothetical protein
MQKVDQWMPRARGRKQQGVTANRCRVSLGSDEKVLKLDCGYIVPLGIY